MKDNEKCSLAILEADKWKMAGEVLNNSNYYKQSAVIKVFAIELYFKAILLNKNIKFDKTHNLYTLYADKMPSKIKRNIKNTTINKLGKEFFPYNIYDLYTNSTICIVNSFEDALSIISNNFVDLRYWFSTDTIEKREKTKVILFNFITNLENAAKDVAYNEYNTNLQ